MIRSPAPHTLFSVVHQRGSGSLKHPSGCSKRGHARPVQHLSLAYLSHPSQRQGSCARISCCISPQPPPRPFPRPGGSCGPFDCRPAGGLGEHGTLSRAGTRRAEQSERTAVSRHTWRLLPLAWVPRAFVMPSHGALTLGRRRSRCCSLCSQPCR